MNKPHSDMPAQIYLIKLDNDDYVWCEDPCPSEHSELEDATQYHNTDQLRELLIADMAKILLSDFHTPDAVSKYSTASGDFRPVHVAENTIDQFKIMMGKLINARLK